ncbi:MAG TPA: acyl-ACP--UDP-N-acetylglucosamine O-acyltransferase [Candidatus Didemnitutus sp.]|nr:acyl-ACP--UDP-N-acetylglucosamine O-acyltransferase [Candidatus Didemnitutus sp.]
MTVHPTALVEEGVELGAGCVVHAHAIIKRHSILGPGVVVHPFAVIGGDPQDLRFDPATKSGVRIGARTVVRESVTISRATRAGTNTEIGEDCFLMACSHVAHDCHLGNRVILANGVLLAGHVTIGDHAFFGGAVLVHQFVRIGESTMISGATRAAQDVPPYTLAAERNEVIGLNLIGLKRRGFSRDAIRELKDAFRHVYFTPGNIRTVAAAALSDGTFKTDEARHFLTFFAEGKRGFARARSAASADESPDGA